MRHRRDVPVCGPGHPDGGDRAVVPVAAPAVYCPFPPRISPHAARVQRYAVEWAARHGFLPDAAAREAFGRARFAALMSRAYPDAGYPDLCLAVDWLTFMFRLDDHLETRLGRDRPAQRAVRELVLARLSAPGTAQADAQATALGTASATAQPPAPRQRRGTASEPAGPPDGPLVDLLGAPLAGSLADLWRRTAARTGPGWRDRFVRHVAEYLDANDWEAANRTAGRLPGVEEYVRMRRASAATAVFFDFIEVFAGAELPTAVAAHPGLLRLRRCADDLVAWFNDLVSWPKELAAGDPHNLVLVLAHERGVPVERAVRLAADRHDARVCDLLTVRDGLEAPLLARPGVRVVVDGLTVWVRANVDWSRESGRYAPTT
jgi:hypothetical protein